MKAIKIVAIIFFAFVYQHNFAQGCESPGEGDGIKFFGFIQPQYNHVLTGLDGERTSDNDTSGFFFNRARFGVMGNIPYDFSYYFIVEYAPAAGFGVCDAYVSYDRYKPYMSASMGQFKAPFGAENLQGCHKLYTIDRSMVTNNIGAPIRDMGLMISGGTGDKIKIGEGVTNVLGYQLALLNGEGRDLISNDVKLSSLPDNLKTFVGRLTFTPSKYVTFGGSYKQGKHTPTLETATEDDVRTRYGFDVHVNYKNFILAGEYIYGKDQGSVSKTEGDGCGATIVTVPGTDEKEGYYLTALYKTKWNIEPVVKYEVLDASLTTEKDKVMRWTTGINYHFNEWTRLQINYQYKLTETKIPVGTSYQDVLQIQLQAIIK